jgi:putative hydrolase of the HAD superfamily
MVGDNYHTDIIGAMNAGLDTILFNHWKIDIKTLERQPTYIVGKLMDISKIL